MRKEMFRLVALGVSVVLPTLLFGQLNPKQGFVITNENDTVYGTIDYLSDTKCAYECRFKPDGEPAYKVYRPGDISAYRFSDNGVFYVTKTFPVGGEQKTFFAEYLLQGGVSLFHHRTADVDYYFFINEDGTVATVKNDGGSVQYSYDALTKKGRVNRKRAVLGEVTKIFAQSEKALHDLWVKDINAKNLTQITHDYDMEYCTSAGDCVQFRYSEKATRSVVAKLRLQAGVGIGSNKLEGTKVDASPRSFICNSLTMKCFVPQLGVGADLLFPRSNKHWSVQALAFISRWSMSDSYYARLYDDEKRDVSLKYWDLGAQIGPAYSFLPDSKWSPVVRAGLAIDMPFGFKKTNLEYLKFNIDDLSTAFALGFYVGAGVDIAIRKYVLRLTAEYQWSCSSNDGTDISRLSLNAGIRL